MEAWERRDTGFILECLTEDAVYQSVPQRPIEGKGAVATWVRGFVGKPPGRLEVHHQAASGDVVMNERTDVITLNGRTVTLPICAVFEIHDGRIAAWREYLDLAPRGHVRRHLDPDSRAVYAGEHGLRRGSRRTDPIPGRRADLSEKKMLGGLAFLIGGNMAITASGQGGIWSGSTPNSRTGSWPRPRHRWR